MNSNEQTDSMQNLRALIGSMEIAMLTTVDSDGRLESRPMASQEMDADGVLWFFTSRQSQLRRSIESSAETNVAYANSDRHCYASVTGRATIVDDADQFRLLWKPDFSVWFPDGTDEPDLILIRVQMEHADYWLGPANVVVRVMGLAKALFTGRQESRPRHDRVEP